MAAKRKGSSRSSSRIRSGRPKSPKRGITHRKSSRSVSRRSTSSHRTVKRNLKRAGSSKRAAKIVSRPRPAARPKIVPTRVLSSAKTSREVSRGAVRPRRAIRPSSRDLKKALPSRGVAASTAAAVVGSLYTLRTGAASPEMSLDVSALQTSLDELQDRASFMDLQADITSLDSNLNHALNLLESARDKGFKYQNDLEEIAIDAMRRWQGIRDDVEANIVRQVTAMESQMGPVDASVAKLNTALDRGNANSTTLRLVQREVDRVLNTVYETERTVQKAYSDIESQASALTYRLTRVHWMLTQLDEATFDLNEDENVYMAVKARWDQEGKDDPEGLLFITNQRLIFERKEKIATKKILFVTTASELVQEVMISYGLANIKNSKAHNKGLFGHQDFLDVTFKDQSIPFHIDGQDSAEWARMITDAKSGKIADEIATGSGLSFADLTGKVTQADIIDLQNEVNELQDEMMLKDAEDELSELDIEVGSLSRELSDVRARGYIVEKSLEADAEILAGQWQKIKKRSITTMEYQTKQLGSQMKRILDQTAIITGLSGNLTKARPMYMQLKSAIASAEAQAAAAEATVLDQYDEYADEVETMDSHLEWVDWMLDALETASFKLLATESGVAAVDAIWERSGSDPQNGILFLTDQRLIWEDREGEFEVKLEVPMNYIENVKEDIDKETGAEGLKFSLTTDAVVNKAKFSLGVPVADNWVQMTNRARSDGYNEDRSVKIEASELERIRNAPEQCPNCGASFTAPILRGQTEITWEFCGVVTRI
ncbi:MAG: hypothetical protein N2D54_03250 [Chloroflexota bacterium]